MFLVHTGVVPFIARDHTGLVITTMVPRNPWTLSRCAHGHAGTTAIVLYLCRYMVPSRALHCATGYLELQYRTTAEAMPTYYSWAAFSQKGPSYHDDGAGEHKYSGLGHRTDGPGEGYGFSGLPAPTVTCNTRNRVSRGGLGWLSSIAQ